MAVQTNELKLARLEHAADQRLIQLKEQLSQRVQEHTVRVTKLSNVKGENYHLQQMLDDAQLLTQPDETEERKRKDREERQKMRNHVAQQINEIQVLKVFQN